MSLSTPLPQLSEIPELQEMFEQLREYIAQYDTKNHIKLLRKMYAYASHINAEKELGIIKGSFAKYYFDRGKYKLALKYLYEALPIVQKYGLTRRVSNLYNWLGGIYLFNGDYSTALDSFLMEIDHNIKSGIEEHCFIAYTALGNIYIEIGDPATAEKFLLKAKEVAIKYPDFADVKMSKAHLNTSFIELRICQEQYPEAERLCYETLEMKDVKDKRIAPCIYCFLALIHNRRQQYEQAINFAIQSEEKVDESDIENRINSARVKAKAYIALSDYKHAAEEINKSLDLIKAHQHKPSINIEFLKEAEKIFQLTQDNSNLYSIQARLKEAELQYHALQLRMSIRASQVIEFANKYYPGNIKSTRKFLNVHAVYKGEVSLPIDKIYACQKQLQNKVGKNNTSVFVKGNKTPYVIPSPLHVLYELINNPAFVWIHKNAFINTEHIKKNSLEIEQKGVVVKLYGNRFEVSRSNKSNWV